MQGNVTTVGIALMIGFVGLLSIAPSGIAPYHGGATAVVDFCPTDPAYNATSSVADATGQPAVHVDINDLQPFDPASLTIDAGTCVEWENHGNLEHTVDIVGSTDGALASEHIATLQPGGSTHHTFDEPGTYHLHCEFNALHEATMHQVIRVV